MTVEEELNKLEDDLRRLKVEYEIYFNGSAPRPPHDTLYRVETMVKRYSSDQSKLNFSQRYRFTSLVQKFAVNSQLWRRKLQEKEEGRSLTGVPKRVAEQPAADGGARVADSKPQAEPAKAAEQRAADGVVRVVCSNPEAEPAKVAELLRAMQDAKRRAQQPDKMDAAAFHKFILDQTRKMKGKFGCDKVQFTVSIEDGKAKLKATKAE